MEENRRLQSYRRILRKNPPFERAVRAVLSGEGSDAYSPEEKLYVSACAPVLLCFVMWALGEARAAGIRRLYFLARDGYPMYLAARKLCAAWGVPIECRYLYVSRYAVRRAEHLLLGRECVRDICARGIDVTFEKVMRRAGLDGGGGAGFCGERARDLILSGA